MKNKKGFTLIELVAVLVILAIIALIIVPIVLRIINDARREANERSVDALGRSIEYSVALYALNNEGAFPEDCTIDECYTNIYDNNGNVVSKVSEQVEYTGAKVSGCTVELANNKCVKLSNCKVNGTKVDYTFNRCVR